VKQSSLIALLLLAASSTGLSATVYDDFNLKQWDIFRGGTGPSVHEAHQRVEMSFAANSSDAPGTNEFFVAYGSKCELQGDFDVQVDFALLRFPKFNGVRIGIGFANAAVERTSFSQHDVFPVGEVYLVGGNSYTILPTTDMTGKLRAVRVGGVFSGYYFDATLKTWHFIGSTSITTATNAFALQVWSGNSVFDDKPIKVAWDNVILNSGTLVGASCPFSAK
jgi:hypothetical protein